MINIKFEDVSKCYKDFSIEKLNYEFEAGKSYVITGNSGSGKSTILNMCGMLDIQDTGNIYIMNKRNIKLESKEGREILRNNIGYMFQNYGLVEDKTVYENLALIYDFKRKTNPIEIQSVLRALGLNEYDNRHIYTLSGGEAQRVAIAKLLLKKPKIILADEPTGNLDESNSKKIIQYLLKLVNKESTLIVVTHDLDLLNYFDEVIYI